MSGRGKGKSSKKAVSRSAKAGLQFPVGRIARYAFFYVSFFFKPHTVWDSFVFLLIIFKKNESVAAFFDDGRDDDDDFRSADA